MSGGESSGSPRWSVVTPVTAVPAPMAGLPGSRAMVWVGPPLSASGARSRSARLVRTMLPSGRSTIPPEPPVPIRLYVPVTLGAGHAPISLVPPVAGVAGDDRVGESPASRRRRCRADVAADRAGGERRRAVVGQAAAGVDGGVAADRAVGERRRAERTLARPPPSPRSCR